MFFARTDTRRLLALAAGLAVAIPASGFQYPTNATAIAWGNSALAELPQEARALAENGYAVLVVHSDGSVEGSSIFGPLDGPLEVPTDLEPLVDVALSDFHAVGLQEDGGLVGWGILSEFGEPVDPPILPPEIPPEEDGVTAIGAGRGYAVALTGRGRLVVWGEPAVVAVMEKPELSDGIALSAGAFEGLVLRESGRVAHFGQAGGWGAGPQFFGGITDATGVACGASHALVLHGDGTVSGFGAPPAAEVPEGLGGVQAVAVGDDHSLALKTDGTVVAWGNTPPVPEGLAGVIAIYAGGRHSVAWTKAPFISKQPESVVAVEPGTPVALSVEVIDRHPVTYQWWRGEEPVDGATGASLELAEPTESDTGFYRVLVSNGDHEVSSREALVVVGKPWILAGPESTTALALSEAVFRVETASPTPVTYQWRFNGVPIIGATTSELRLTRLSAADQGEYSVEASNAYGSLTSLPALLTVIADAPLDQGQFQTRATIALRGGEGEIEIAQTFVPGLSGLLDRVSFSASAYEPAVEWPTAISIVEAQDGQPTGATLGRVVAHKLVGDMEVSWRGEEVYMVKGRQYAILFTTDSPMTPSTAYSFRTSYEDSYPDGDLWKRLPGSDWQPAYSLNDGETWRDLVFATYMFPGLPSIRLATPRAGATLRVGEAAVLTAIPNPEVTVPDQVELLANDLVLASLTIEPFTWDWTPLEAGQFTLVARSTTGGDVTLSAPVAVVVRPAGPANDDFGDREPLLDDYAVVNPPFAGATLEPDEASLWPEGVEGSVWWEWTAPRSGPVVVVATGPEGGTTLVGAFSGGQLDSLVPNAQVERTCTFNAQQGRTYAVALASDLLDPTGWSLTLAQADVGIIQPVDGLEMCSPASLTVSIERLGDGRDLAEVEIRLNGAVVATLPGSLDPDTTLIQIERPGFYTLTAAALDQAGVMVESSPVSLTVRPSNDDYQQATGITGHFVEIEGSNVAGTRQGFEPLWASNQGGASVWYRWTSPAAGLCTLSGKGTDPATGWDFDVLLAAFREGVPGLTTRVAQNVGARQAPCSWMALEGTTYWILVDGWFGEQGDLTVQLRLRPPNDDFAAAYSFDGLRQDTLTSFAGTTADPGQDALEGLANAPSLWWEWRAPLSAPATLSATSETGDVRIVVGEQAPLASFTLLADSGPDWSGQATVSLQVSQGALYRIGVFAAPGTEPDCRVSWESDVLQVVSPRDTSALPVPASVRLLAVSGQGDENTERIEYRVNNALAGVAVEPPFSVTWEVTEPGVYRVEATRYGVDGNVQTSLPVPFLAFAGDDLPEPRLFAGPIANSTYVVNALGEVRLCGVNSGQFGLTPEDGLTTLRVADLPEGVHAWKSITAGLTDAAWSESLDRWFFSDVVRFTSWALTDDGRLFSKGVTETSFPPGVSAWRKVVVSHSGMHAISEEGRIFENATTELVLPVDPIAWADFRMGPSAYGFMASLAQDGRAFGHVHDSHDELQSVAITLRTGATRWVALEIAEARIVLLDDLGRLFQTSRLYYGKPPVNSLSQIPFPEGGSRWVSFSSGSSHVLALADNGQLFSWGDNGRGQLGIGQTGGSIASPNRVPPPPGVTRWSAVAAGRYHSLALGDDCALYAWGDNTVGQLGLGHGAPVTVPTRVPNSGVLCGFPVVYTEGETSRLPDGRFRLQFRSDRNRSYLIQYSDDLQGGVWQTALPPVLGTGGLLEWIDDGPPMTEPHPAEVPSRFYRVVFN